MRDQITIIFVCLFYFSKQNTEAWKFGVCVCVCVCVCARARVRECVRVLHNDLRQQKPMTETMGEVRGCGEYIWLLENGHGWQYRLRQAKCNQMNQVFRQQKNFAWFGLWWLRRILVALVLKRQQRMKLWQYLVLVRSCRSCRSGVYVSGSFSCIRTATKGLSSSCNSQSSVLSLI